MIACFLILDFLIFIILKMYIPCFVIPTIVFIFFIFSISDSTNYLRNEEIYKMLCPLPETRDLAFFYSFPLLQQYIFIVILDLILLLHYHIIYILL